MLFREFKLIDNGKIIIAMKTLKNYSSPTLDEVTVQSLNKLLSYIFHLAVGTSTTPDSFKILVIIPIYKKGDKFNIKSYCLIPQVSDFFERIIKK